MKKKVFIPADTSALSLRADEVALEVRREAGKRKIAIDIIRTGSRGAFWLEPVVEAGVPGGRAAYGPVSPKDVKSLFDAGFITGGSHPLSLGYAEEIPYLKNQDRVIFKRVGVVDPLSIEDYGRHGGIEGLKRALAISPDEIIEEVKRSGLRGRGGAAFPTGIKWETAGKADSRIKYIVCNADEGDSGSFSDRMIMEGDPFSLIEGIIIAGIAIGAESGYIYLRSEYPFAGRVLKKAIGEAYDKGVLGESVLESGTRFDLGLVIGGGSYVCGEETALLESLENRRGMVRPRPPAPATRGLFDKPTVVNNVLTLATVTVILEKGAGYYGSLGAGNPGTLPVQLCGNVKQPGLIEKAFGASLKELIYGFGQGSASGRPVKALQIGGPLGAFFPASILESGITLNYEDLASRGGILGHGGIVVFDDTTDMAYMAVRSLEFALRESCGKCVPCRMGSIRAFELLGEALKENAPGKDKDLEIIREIFIASSNLSLCGLGGMMHLPVVSALKYFHEDFGLKAPFVF